MTEPTQEAASWSARDALERDVVLAALDAGTADAEASAALDAYSAAQDRAGAAQRRLEAATKALRDYAAAATPVAELARSAGGVEL